MKKALLVAVSFILFSFLLVSGTFAMPDLNDVFSDLSAILGEALGKPVNGGAGTPVHVALVSDDAPQSLFPGITASRTTYVQNKGEGDVYLRLAYAIQYDAETWGDLLKVQFQAGEGFFEHDWQDISVSGTPYKMKVFTYNAALPSASDTPSVTISLTMDASVTSQQFSRYRSDFLRIQALAIDPTPFVNKGYLSAQEALDMAIPLNTLNPF